MGSRTASHQWLSPCDARLASRPSALVNGDGPPAVLCPSDASSSRLEDLGNQFEKPSPRTQTSFILWVQTTPPRTKTHRKRGGLRRPPPFPRWLLRREGAIWIHKVNDFRVQGKFLVFKPISQRSTPGSLPAMEIKITKATEKPAMRRNRPLIIRNRRMPVEGTVPFFFGLVCSGFRPTCGSTSTIRGQILKSIPGHPHP